MLLFRVLREKTRSSRSPFECAEVSFHCSICVFMWISVCTVSVHVPFDGFHAFTSNFITHRNPQIVEGGFARCRRLHVALLQIYRFANRRSDRSMGWVSVVKLFKSSSPLQTETAAVLAFETLLATGQGPRQTTVVSRTRTSWITGSFSGGLIIARPQLVNILCDIKKKLHLKKPEGQIFLEWWASIWLRVSSVGQIPLCFTILTITY